MGPEVLIACAVQGKRLEYIRSANIEPWIYDILDMSWKQDHKLRPTATQLVSAFEHKGFPDSEQHPNKDVCDAQVRKDEPSQVRKYEPSRYLMLRICPILCIHILSCKKRGAFLAGVVALVAVSAILALVLSFSPPRLPDVLPYTDVRPYGTSAYLDTAGVLNLLYRGSNCSGVWQCSFESGSWIKQRIDNALPAGSNPPSVVGNPTGFCRT